MSNGRCSVRLTRRYVEPPAEVWAALTDAESLARWLAPGFEVEPAAVEPGRVLEIAWRPPGEEPSLVRVELAPDRDGTILVLEHSRIDEPLGMRYAARWVERFENLPFRPRS